jgi:hypothetical protein
MLINATEAWPQARDPLVITVSGLPVALAVSNSAFSSA